MKSPKKPKTSSAKVTAPLRNNKNSKNFGLFGKKRSKQAGANLTGGKQDAWRYVAVWAVMGLFFAAIVARAAYLQIFNAQFYIEKGDDLITKEQIEPAYRGVITDRAGAPLAANAPLYTVFFDPYAYAEEYYRLVNEMNTSKSDATKQRALEKLKEMDLVKLAGAANFPLEKLEAAVKIDPLLDTSDSQKVAAALPKGAGSRRLVLLNREIGRAHV